MISFQGLPSSDLTNGLFRAWWFEPLEATICFGIFINYYWYFERKYGYSATKKFIDTVFLGEGPLFSSGVAYWVGIFAWKCFVPPAAQVIPDGVPTTPWGHLYLAAEVISGIVLYDAIFFLLHWSMHHVQCLRFLHKRHHQVTNKSVETCDVLRHSLFDGGLQVFVNILVQRQTPWGSVKTRLARALHNIIVIWMLTESHCASPSPKIWRRWFTGVREHYLHHSVYPTNSSHRHRYQQFFGYLDDIRVFFS